MAAAVGARSRKLECIASSLQLAGRKYSQLVILAYPFTPPCQFVVLRSAPHRLARVLLDLARFDFMRTWPSLAAKVTTRDRPLSVGSCGPNQSVDYKALELR